MGINENSISNKAIKNYYPKNGIEFVFDTETNTFVVGKDIYNQWYGSPHQRLAASIDANQSTGTILGGIFSRGINGKIYTTENSGHFGMNWTSEYRMQFVDIMSKYGLDVIHEIWR